MMRWCCSSQNKMRYLFRVGYGILYQQISFSNHVRHMAAHLLRKIPSKTATSNHCFFPPAKCCLNASMSSTSCLNV